MVRRLIYGGDRVGDTIASLKALSQAFPGENFFVKFNNTYVFPFDTIGSSLRKMHDGGAYLKEQLESHPEYDLKEMESAVGFDYSAKPDPNKVEEAVLHYLRSIEKERRGNMRKVADSSIYFSPVVISDVGPEIAVRGLRHDGGNEVWGLVRQENLDDFDPDIDYNEDWRPLEVSELLKVLEDNKDLAEKVGVPVVLDYGIGIDVNLFAKQFSHDIRFAHSFVNDSSIDPATVATLHLEKEFDTGLAIYRTEPSLESRDDLIRVLFSHYNKDSYPWSQLQNDDYLNYNWSHPNRVAFVDGHPVAFNYGIDDPWWLDPYGVGKYEICGSIGLEADPLGRSVEAVFSEDGSVRYNGVFRMVDRFYLEIFESVESSVPESIKVSLFDVTTDIPEKFIIKEGTTIIGWQAFAHEKGLKEVYIPGSVKDIESFAFYGCTSLREVHIPNSVKYIGRDVFKGCDSLKEVHVSATAPQALIDTIRAAVPGGYTVLRDLPEKDLAALRERGVSEAAIRELQENGFVHIKEKTFYRPSTATSPCPEGARTVAVDAVATIEGGVVKMRDPKTGKPLGDMKSFFENTKKQHAAHTKNSNRQEDTPVPSLKR